MAYDGSGNSTITGSFTASTIAATSSITSPSILVTGVAGIKVGTGGTPFSILEWGTGTLISGQATIGISNLGAGNACCIVTPRTLGAGILSANQDFSGGQLDILSSDPATGLLNSSDNRSFSYLVIDIET